MPPSIITQLSDEELSFQTDQQALKYLGADPDGFEIMSIEDELNNYYRELYRRGIYPDGDVGK